MTTIEPNGVTYTIKERKCHGCACDLPELRRDGYCKDCRAEATRRWRKENPAAALESGRRGNAKRRGTRAHLRSHLARTYGMSLEDYWGLVEIQDGVCDICLQAPDTNDRLHVDHDHDSGRIRGLLCGNCNRALGLLGENPENARRAAIYLLAEKKIGTRAA